MINAVLIAVHNEFLYTFVGMRFAKCVLMTSWEGVLDVLSILISGNASCGITSSLAILFNAKEETRKMQEAICASLEALQTAARLSCILGRFYGD